MCNLLIACKTENKEFKSCFEITDLSLYFVCLTFILPLTTKNSFQVIINFLQASVFTMMNKTVSSIWSYSPLLN